MKEVLNVQLSSYGITERKEKRLYVPHGRIPLTKPSF